jgi:hypothetical protein
VLVIALAGEKNKVAARTMAVIGIAKMIFFIWKLLAKKRDESIQIICKAVSFLHLYI